MQASQREETQKHDERLSEEEKASEEETVSDCRKHTTRLVQKFRLRDMGAEKSIAAIH
jgi:hypothetical protein